MRLILAAAATALAVGVIASTVAFTQTNTNNPSTTRASPNESYNRCVSLASSRAYTDSDLDGNQADARNFVLRCMQGKQR
jgi:hypothetical protein